MILAIEDAVIFNWVIGALAVGIPAIGAAIWRLWTQFIRFIQPMIETLYEKFRGGLEEHRQLVVAMEKNVPVVAHTLATISATQDKLADTLDGQSKAIARLDVRHGEHSQKLDSILQKLKGPEDGAK